MILHLRCLIAFFFILVLVYSLPGCSNDPEKDTPVKNDPSISKPVPGGIFRSPLRSEPAALDPSKIKDIYGIALVHQLFDGLVKFDAYLNILPALARTWQVDEEGRVYRFQLRNNAMFHNGDPVTSQDVVFSLSRLLKTTPAPAILPHLLKIAGAERYQTGQTTHVSGLEIIDALHFNIRLKESYVPFLTALGMYQAAIVPQKEVEKKGSAFGKQPIGSGPFQFVAWDRGKEIRLKRFDQYHEGPALLDGIQYKIYQGGQDPEVLKDFQNGLLEEMAVYGDRKKLLENQKNLRWFHRPSLSLFFYGLNIQHPDLCDPNFRKALSAAIDRKRLVSSVYRNQYETAQTILPPGMPGYSPLNKIPDNDPVTAQKWISRISQGQKLPKEIEIVSAIQTPLVEKEMALISEFWSQLGITLDVKYIPDWEKFEAYIQSDKVQIFRSAWFADMPDPDSFLDSLFSSDSPTRVMNYKNRQVDQMLSQARQMLNPVERARMIQKIEQTIIDGQPLIPLFYLSVDRVFQPYVKSVNINALGAHTMPLNKIWFDRDR